MTPEVERQEVVRTRQKTDRSNVVLLNPARPHSMNTRRHRHRSNQFRALSNDEAASIVQKAMRVCVYRRRERLAQDKESNLLHQLELMAVVQIQTLYRGYRVRLCHCASLKIQQLWREYSNQRKSRAARIIQVKVQNQSARVIQVRFRQFVQDKRKLIAVRRIIQRYRIYSIRTTAGAVIQSVLRTYCRRQIYKRKLLILKKARDHFQQRRREISFNIWNSFCAEAISKRKYDASALIQLTWRIYKINKSVCRIQRAVRWVVIKIQSCKTIQRVFRGFIDRKHVVLLRKKRADRFQCTNCGRMEPSGVYCKGCGRRKRVKEKVQLPVIKTTIRRKKSITSPMDRQIALETFERAKEINNNNPSLQLLHLKLKRT